MSAAIVIIQAGPWGRRFEVTTEPPVARHLPQTFREREEALAQAELIACIEGWSIHDRCSPSDGR